MTYKRSDKLQALKDQGVNKWSELKAHGIIRCCASGTNRRTGKAWQCRCEALGKVDGRTVYYCEKHSWVDRTIRDLSKAATDAEKEQSETANAKYAKTQKENAEYLSMKKNKK